MGDAEEIKRRMLAQMQQQMAEEQQQAQQEALEAQKKALMRQLLDSEARARLERIKMAKPETAAYIENQLIMLYQMGRIRERITDEVFKELLKRLVPEKRDIRIRRI